MFNNSSGRIFPCGVRVVHVSDLIATKPGILDGPGHIWRLRSEIRLHSKISFQDKYQEKKKGSIGNYTALSTMCIVGNDVPAAHVNEELSTARAPMLRPGSAPVAFFPQHRSGRNFEPRRIPTKREQFALLFAAQTPIDRVESHGRVSQPHQELTRTSSTWRSSSRRAARVAVTRSPPATSSASQQTARLPWARKSRHVCALTCTHRLACVIRRRRTRDETRGTWRTDWRRRRRRWRWRCGRWSENRVAEFPGRRGASPRFRAQERIGTLRQGV